MDLAFWWFWLIAGILLLVAEMLTGTFYLLWLGIAALVAAVLAYFFPENLWLPPVGASSSALLLLLLTKPLTARARLARGYHDPSHQLVNLHGEVVEKIAPGRLGIVRVGNEVWSAKAQEELDMGQRVLVVSQSSTVLQVVPIK
ncbi:NfeD family protein [Rufibacter latericius]|uniref:NfeD family protein n=1 Tax=Rufibacter latericius TaxID=2487040 RepID=A0A3M9N031_9BACT|nr:NfeD family protein [Rufibacter latericius]RNI31130.1 NfeD family protein [Rufibacter latericius]